MSLDLPKFYTACNPNRPLDRSKAEDRQYYIDLTSVRGDRIIEAIERTITRISPAVPTCQLFTGHIGCGKSTELLSLKAKLEQQNFHVVYLECDKYLEVGEVDISDILLVIAGQVSASLEAVGINLLPQYFQNLFAEVMRVMQSPVEISGKFSLGIAEITTKTKDSPKLRDRIRQRLEPRTSSIIEAINQELLQPAIELLKQQQKKGLVVIVDNLDRIENKSTVTERSQPGYLFIDRGEQLRRLSCHVVYTIPLVLMFSNDYGTLNSRFGAGVRLLPMVPVKLRDGSECAEGMALLRQMVLARAFPEANPLERLNLVTELFDYPATLDRLCHVSGGHVRNLLALLYGCLQQSDPPFSAELLERLIQQSCNDRSKAISEDEWDLLRRVSRDKTVTGEEEYQTLIRSMFVFEYNYQQDNWFDINPLLEKSKKLNPS